MVNPSPFQRPIVDPLPRQRPYNSKAGLGYVAPKKSKNKKKAKKVNPAQAKKTPTTSGVVIRDNTPRSDFAGTDRKSTRLNSSHITRSRMPSSA